MADRNSRGQCALEAALVMMVLTTFVLGFYLTAEKAASTLKPSTLSTGVAK